MESAISDWKEHSADLRKTAPSLTCKWWWIALNPFSNQCSLKSYHALETNGSKQRNAFCAHCERGSGWSYVYVNLVRSVLESLVPNFTLGPSWSIHCCLRPWFSLFHLLYHLCGLLYAYLICEGVKGVGRKYGVGGSYFVLWHFFWLSLNNHLIVKWGGEVVNCVRVAVHFQEKNGRAISASVVLRRWPRKQLASPCPYIYILWEGCQLFYFKGCMGENLRYILKNTLWKWLKWA